MLTSPPNLTRISVQINWIGSFLLHFFGGGKTNIKRKKSLKPTPIALTTWCQTNIHCHLLRRFGMTGHPKNISTKHSSPQEVHPGRLTSNIVMEVWKIIFLFRWVICSGWFVGSMLIFQGVFAWMSRSGSGNFRFSWLRNLPRSESNSLFVGSNNLS